jgi:DNA polymerase-3 subunit alpha
LLALVRVGALPFGNRAQLEAALPAAQKAAKAKKPEQVVLPDLPEYPPDVLLGYEYDLLGVHLTSVPVEDTVERLEKAGRINATTATLDGKETAARLAGVIVGGREVQSRYGIMYVFNLNDGRGLIEVSVYPRLYKEQSSLLKEGKLVIIEGKAEVREGRVRLQAAKVESAVN